VQLGDAGGSVTTREKRNAKNFMESLFGKVDNFFGEVFGIRTVPAVG